MADATEFVVVLLSWLLAAVFAHAAYLNLTGPAFIRDEFQRWGFPAWFRYLVGALELLALILGLFSATRLAGMVMLGALLLGVCWTLAKEADWHRLAFPLVLMALVALVIALGPAAPLFPFSG
ncbi:MAG TPA: DoxX family protein [Eoetvoesiella sp.]